MSLFSFSSSERSWCLLRDFFEACLCFLVVSRGWIYIWENLYKKIIYKKKRILEIKNNLLELQKDFKELGDKDAIDRVVKIRKEIEEQFFKPIKISVDYMDKFEETETMKKRLFAKKHLVQLVWFVN